MPTAAPNSIRKCTDTIGHLSCTGLAVCHAGDRVALHLTTPRGVVVATIDTAKFIIAARGPRDHNGNPWSQAAVQSAVPCAAAAAVTAPKLAASPQPVRRIPRGQGRAICEPLFQAWTRAPLTELAHLADRAGICRQSLYNHCTKFHPGEVARLRAAAKRDAQARADAEVHGLKLPFTKPSGRIL